MTKPPFCTSYDEARQIYIEGELQAWDGTRWEDIPAGSTPFFSRRVEEYRRRPTAQHAAPKYLVWSPDQEQSKRVRHFDSAHGVALFLWEKDLKETVVFKRCELSGYDLRKLEEQLKKA
jgi:hypothetical protein